MATSSIARSIRGVKLTPNPIPCVFHRVSVHVSVREIAREHRSVLRFRRFTGLQENARYTAILSPLCYHEIASQRSPLAPVTQTSRCVISVSSRSPVHSAAGGRAGGVTQTVVFDTTAHGLEHDRLEQPETACHTQREVPTLACASTGGSRLTGLHSFPARWCRTKHLAL